MAYLEEDVLSYVKEEDVKFIRLTFVDIYGIQKNISIMENQLEKAFSKGIKIDSKSIAGYEKYESIVLHPDPNTISVLPWRPSQGRVIRMFCNITDTNEAPLKEDSRDLLIKAKQLIEEDIKFKTEFEFYLFKLDEEGNNTKIPYDNASYYDIAPLDKGENVRREICLSLDEMEIPTCGSHHSFGPGQNKISLVEEVPLRAAENAITFESVVRTISSRNGLHASFTNKPLVEFPSSSHMICIKAPKDKLMTYYTNLKNHYDEIYYFLNNTPHLYHSYDENHNVEFDSFNEEIHLNRISHEANSYLAYAILIYALLDDSKEDVKKATSLLQAKENAKNSKFIFKHLPKELLESYLK